MMRGASADWLGPVTPKRCSGGGSLLLAAKIAPFGARGRAASAEPERAKVG